MTYKTHFNFGILLSLLFLTRFYKVSHLNISTDIIIFIIIGGVLALIPDADHSNSKINKICAPSIYILILFYLVYVKHIYILLATLIWAVIAIMGKHRYFTHCIIGLLVFTIPFIGSQYLTPVFVGYTSHLIADLFTDRGLPLLYPFTNKKFKLGFITTGGTGEKIICTLLIIANIYSLIKIFI
jgi:inner membrane protein